ncbi:MAG TPA: OmpH family outer membrane protein, partial [Syntrophales bacterium]|nr:OmpH family outer membrane protein [Syntrophales bacterium]
MKKAIYLLVVISFIAASACFAAAGEIAFVNMKDILLHSDAGKAATLDLKKFVEDKKAAIQEKEEALQKLKDNLEKQRAILTDSAYQEKELSYQKEYRDYKRFIEDANEEMKTMDQDLSRKLLPEALKVINTIGEKGGYT